MQSNAEERSRETNRDGDGEEVRKRWLEMKRPAVSVEYDGR